MREFLDDIEAEFAVNIEVDIPPTHTFDFNAQDALYNSELKRFLKKQGFPKEQWCDLEDKVTDAVNSISLNDIQRRFMRAYSRDENGDENPSLIPESITDWYSEKEMSSEEWTLADANVDSEEVHTDEEGN